MVGDTTIARERLDTLLREAKADVWKGMWEAWQHKWLMIRSSLIGVFVGIMPGVGGSAAHWIAYAQARQTEKGAMETFGKGDIPFTNAPALTTATAMTPMSVSRKNSAEPNHRSISRLTGSDIRSAMAPITPPTNVVV